jgi:capsid portal protein
VSERIRKAVRVGVTGPPEGTTTQPEDQSAKWTPEHALLPPADLERLASLTSVARSRRPCIEATVLNTVGRGVEVVPREGQEDDAEDDEAAELLKRFDDLARRDVRLGRPSFKRLLAAAKWDEEEVGNGYLEVARNRITGEISGLFHIPGKEVRRRKDRKGWVVGPKNGSAADRVEFYDFGEKVKYDADGHPEGTLNGNGKRWDRNEIIPFRLYTSKSRDYGLPRDEHLAIDYLGDRNAAEANVGFFAGGGVPPTVIFLKAPQTENSEDEIEIEIPPELPAKIAAAMKADGDRRNRVAFFSLPEGVEPDKIDLASLSERDMGFIEFRKDNRRATLGAWRMAPIFIADIEDTNYSTAETERKLTKEQLFDPEQDRWEDILTETLLREMAPHMQFKFTELDVTDEKAVRESADSAGDRGEITNGEYREAHGFSRLAEAKEGSEPKIGEVEFGWNDMLVTVKGGSHEAVQRGAEAAAQLLAEGNPSGPSGVDGGG